MKKCYYKLRRTALLAAVIAAGACTFSSCGEAGLKSGMDIPGLGGYESENTELDKWLFKSYTEIYNIDVVYRWNPNEISSTAQLVPMFEHLVQPTMDMAKRVWIDPYEKIAGADFVKKIAPKKIVLIGSPQYNEDGSTVQGQAEGALKITIFDGNSYDPANEEWIRSVMHTVQHEFAHILHQTRSYSTSFREISAGSYTSTGWQNYGEADALLEGFYSSYAMSAVDEDFVETMSLIMVYGMEWRQERLDALDYWASMPAPAEETPQQRENRVMLSSMAYEGKSRILAKEEIISSYLMDVWGVRFFDDQAGNKGLVTLVQEAIQEVIDENS